MFDRTIINRVEKELLPYEKRQNTKTNKNI
jgi:hypothetical protein